MPFVASRGSHAPGHIREAFRDWVENGKHGKPTIDDEPIERAWLIGQLWNVSDIMPSGLCDDLDLRAGSTYAQGVRALAAEPES